MARSATGRYVSIVGGGSLVSIRVQFCSSTFSWITMSRFWQGSPKRASTSGNFPRGRAYAFLS
eukprot:1930209-Lingulodinium_polyedra.AAC.1